MKLTKYEIHTANDRTPYTYLIGWSALNKWYYGVRYGKYCHPVDLWTTYFTSSPIISIFREKYGEPDVIQIRKIFNDPIKARLWEDKVHYRMNVVKSTNWLNANYGCAKFDTTGHFAGKTSTGEIIWVSRDDPRVINKEIVGNLIGMVNVKNTLGERFHVSTTDERYLSGELVSIVKGTALAEDNTGKIIGRFDLIDPRWKTGEFISSTYFKNRVATNVGMVAKNDPKLVSGEILHINALNSPCKDATTGKSLGRISTDDLRWKTGEIISLSKNYIACKDAKTYKSLGNIHRSDSRWKTGEIIPLATGTAAAKFSKNGESASRVSLDDPRWKTGEIVGVRKRLLFEDSN